MGRSKLGHHLERLEANSRDQAVGAVREFWDGIPEEDLALIGASHHGIRLTHAQEERLSAVKARMEGPELRTGLERVIRLALGPGAFDSEELLTRRFRDLLERTLYADGRVERVRALVGRLEGKNGRKEP